MNFKLTEITYEKLKAETNYYIEKIYNKASQLFSKASPYGQILDVLQNMFQLSILYLKNSINQFDLSKNNSNNYNIIRSAAIVAGHNPHRAVSASGTLRCQININTDLEEDLPGGQIKISNKTTIKNATNNLFYHIDLGGADEQLLNIQPGRSFYLNIAQGEWKTSDFTGTGGLNQSFEVVPTNKEVENNKVEVRVNGKLWENKNHLYEMIPDEEAVVIRTGFDGGLSVIFGNSNFGAVPLISSLINVSYVETDGDEGNIYRRTSNDWKLVDQILAGDGSTVNFEKLFNVFINTDINFGANGESLEFMKNILPLNTNNFVLALPKQYAYAIRKLGVFSYVNAYREQGTIRIIATPNIRIFKNQNADYFTVDKNAFSLDSYERGKLDQYLRTGGYIQLTQKYTIDTPKLAYYVLYINLQIFDDAIEENINNEIIDKVSEYFLDLSRLDRIPRNDLINIISAIEGVDSVTVRFLSKDNEDYHRTYQQKEDNSIQALNERLMSVDGKLAPTADTNKPNGYDKNKTIGLDPILQDIIFESSQFPILRGGWTDRNGIYYNETPLDGFSSININVKGITPRGNVIKTK